MTVTAELVLVFVAALAAAVAAFQTRHAGAVIATVCAAVATVLLAAAG